MSEVANFVVVHSSDLHLGSTPDNSVSTLAQVVDAARFARGDVLLLVGDVFDHNHVPASMVDDACELLQGAGVPVVILPGNHDCLADDSVYRWSGFASLANVKVIGLSAPTSIVFGDAELEIYGQPHRDYSDFPPISSPPPRSTRWRVTAAHGHWALAGPGGHYSWLIKEGDVCGIDTDYIALGHREGYCCYSNRGILACYSGSPQMEGTVNAIRFPTSGAVEVARVQLQPMILLP